MVYLWFTRGMCFNIDKNLVVVLKYYLKVHAKLKYVYMYKMIWFRI